MPTNMLGNSSRYFFLAIASAGLLPFVPRLDDPAVYLFGFFFLLVVAFALVGFARVPTMDKYGFYTLLFIVYLTFNSIIAIMNGVELADWFRGIAPFLFFATYIIAAKIYSQSLDRLHYAIWVACLLWAGRLLISVGISFLEVLRGGLGRLSYVATEALIPLGMIGFIVSLSHPSLNKSRRYVFAGSFFLLVAMIGYRSQIALCIAVFIAWVSIYGSLKRILVTLIIALPVGAFLLIDSNLPLIDAVMGRFGTISEEKTGVRSSELQYALEKFQESPIVGKGLSYPIPVELTRQGSILEGFEVDQVRYMHNIVGYFLMDTGLLGFIFILVLFGFVAKKIKNSWPHFVNYPPMLGIVFAWLAISVFFLVSASFRQIQTVALYSLMSYMIIKRSKEA